MRRAGHDKRKMAAGKDGSLDFANDDVLGQRTEVSCELHMTIRHKARILAQFASSYVIIVRNPVA
jgi:hypothetical protein